MLSSKLLALALLATLPLAHAYDQEARTLLLQKPGTSKKIPISIGLDLGSLHELFMTKPKTTEKPSRPKHKPKPHKKPHSESDKLDMDNWEYPPTPYWPPPMGHMKPYPWYPGWPTPWGNTDWESMRPSHTHKPSKRPPTHKPTTSPSTEHTEKPHHHKPEHHDHHHYYPYPSYNPYYYPPKPDKHPIYKPHDPYYAQSHPFDKYGETGLGEEYGSNEETYEESSEDHSNKPQRDEITDSDDASAGYEEDPDTYNNESNES